MITYLDSSFLVSQILPDVHSSIVDRCMAQHPEIRITRFNRTEVAHAISLHTFYKKLSLQEAEAAWDEFEWQSQLGIWQVVDVPERAWETAVELAHRYSSKLGVRTLDSLHVACALELQADRFWTFDERQSQLAEAVGLDVSR